MAYSAQTTNYGLPLPNGTDKSTWLDTNEGFQAVDTALAGAVAKGSTNETDIAALRVRMTAAEIAISSDGTDIDALETRMTANEQVAGNALTGVAQLSEKVYDYEERTFTNANEVLTAFNALTETEKIKTYIKSFASDANATVNSTTVSDTGVARTTDSTIIGTRTMLMGYTGWTEGNDIRFTTTIPNPQTTGANEFSWVVNLTEFTVGFNGVMSTATSLIINSVSEAALTSVTLLIPVAVADD